MKSLNTIAPEFVIEVCSSLSNDGFQELETQITSAVVEQCTYDSDADAGYIYLKSSMPPLVAAMHNEAAVVKETLAYGSFNIDIDHEGNVFGIELSGRPDVFSKLQDANTL